MTPREWKRGDRLIHAGRPEWGVGEVQTAESVVQRGERCQRLTVRFERAGVKTLSTAYADLRPREELVGMNSGSGESRSSPIDNAVLEQALLSLPEEATDPFRTRKARLEATLKLYRFGPVGASLLDWATLQTGLKDPLSRFSRHELERLFERFRTAVDAHVRKLVQEMRRGEPAALAEVLASASPEARQALKRLDIGR